MPTSGSVEVVGDVHAMLTIGAVLRDESTGRENIFLDGAIHGRTRSDGTDGGGHYRLRGARGFHRPARATYSSGMKARLAFSMGAFIDPDILIIDETLSVGDAFFSEKAARRMKEIAAAGRIVLMVSAALLPSSTCATGAFGWRAGGLSWTGRLPK